MGGGGCRRVLFSKKKRKNMSFFDKKKHKHYHQFVGHIIWVIWIKLFHCISVLLHIIGSLIGAGGVGHGWVVDDILEFLDLCVFSCVKKITASQH